MAPSPTCPRGHALEPNAVLCTVCWIRVEPVDPVVEAARRRRQRRIWIPLFGATAVLVGVFLGGSIGIIGHTPAAPVAVAEAPAPPAAQAQPAEEPVVIAAPAPVLEEPAMEEPVAVTTVPLAATISAWSTDLCVPAATESIEVSTRAGKDAPWEPAEASVELGAGPACASGQVSATVSLTELVDGATKIKLVSRDSDGAKVQKDKVAA